MTEQSSIRFGSDDWLLFGSALNEVAHGFRVPEFEQVIGVQKEKVEELLVRLDDLQQPKDLLLGKADLLVIRNALRETIRELGVEEFHIRTGFDYEQGQALLETLNRFLRAEGGGGTVTGRWPRSPVLSKPR